MVDGGDLRDGTYVVVDQDARIEHLGYTQKIASRHPNNL
jgi:CO dehydrogenase nickel-insertion accessory protein CooC1